MFVEQDCNIEQIINDILLSNEDEIYFSWSTYSYEDLDKLSDILGELFKLNKQLKIIIGFTKLSEINYLNIKKYINKNLSFSLVLNGFTYSHEDIAKIDEKVIDLIKGVDENLSPYEKYVQIYEIVRKYKEYKIIDQSEVRDLTELINNKEQSSNLRYILDNDYIDCAGYSILLETLLNKVGIEATYFVLDVNNLDGKRLGGHARTLINLVDDKYDINGLFISDATWDINNSSNNLEYSLLPLSSMRNPIYQQCETMLLFDALNENEFLDNTKKIRAKFDNTDKFVKNIISMVDEIDKNKSAELKRLNGDELFYELQNYVISKNQATINNINEKRV